ncbi:MAG: hypothetical protein WAL50_22070 [Kineosporiaceae bacterium]
MSDHSAAAVRQAPQPCRGDRFEDLYAGNFGRLVTQVYFVTGDVEEARDCVQEAFPRAWLRARAALGPLLEEEATHRA